MAQSTTSDTHGAVDDVPTGRVSARTCAAEWTRLWTVKATWWFLVAATVVLVGLGIALGFEAAADPVRLQGEPAWQTAQYIAMPAQFALLASPSPPSRLTTPPAGSSRPCSGRHAARSSSSPARS
jgi:ABC-2 type transport system permease protein